MPVFILCTPFIAATLVVTRVSLRRFFVAGLVVLPVGHALVELLKPIPMARSRTLSSLAFAERAQVVATGFHRPQNIFKPNDRAFLFNNSSL